jgi:hypothetical protein
VIDIVPSTYGLQVASSFSEALNSLLEAYQQLGESIPQLSDYQFQFGANKTMRDILALVYKDILDFHLEALRHFRLRGLTSKPLNQILTHDYAVWKQLFRATWRGFTIRIDAIKRNLDRRMQLIQSQASVVEYEKLLEIHRLADIEFANLKEAELRRRQVELYQWLDSANSSNTQQDCVRKRSACPGAGKWLLNEPSFQNWFHPTFCRTPLLWLNGMPGSGLYRKVLRKSAYMLMLARENYIGFGRY